MVKKVNARFDGKLFLNCAEGWIRGAAAARKVVVVANGKVAGAPARGKKPAMLQSASFLARGAVAKRAGEFLMNCLTSVDELPA